MASSKRNLTATNHLGCRGGQRWPSKICRSLSRRSLIPSRQGAGLIHCCAPVLEHLCSRNKFSMLTCVLAESSPSCGIDKPSRPRRGLHFSSFHLPVKKRVGRESLSHSSCFLAYAIPEASDGVFEERAPS